MIVMFINKLSDLFPGHGAKKRMNEQGLVKMLIFTDSFNPLRFLQGNITRFFFNDQLRGGR